MSVGERYVELCLRLVRHDEELVDFYFGPGEIAERVETEAPREPGRLAEDARSLCEETDSAYLKAQLRGLEIVARKLAGEEIPYVEEVEGFAGTVRVDVAGETVLRAGFGLADRARGLPMAPTTRLAMASGSKTFTALAVLSLVDDVGVHRGPIRARLDDGREVARAVCAGVPLHAVHMRRQAHHAVGPELPHPRGLEAELDQPRDDSRRPGGRLVVRRQVVRHAAEHLAVASVGLPEHLVGRAVEVDAVDRIVVGDLGYRTKAVLTRYPEGVLVQRSGGRSIWIPHDAITAIRTERGIAGKALTHQGILAIRWRLPSGTEIDTGFRGNDRAEYAQWLGEAAA